MAKAYLTPKHEAFLRAVGADIRRLREAADMTQEAIGELFNVNKDAVSKIERGVNTVSLYEYLTVIVFLRDMNPDHPAIPLARKYGMMSK